MLVCENCKSKLQWRWTIEAGRLFCNPYCVQEAYETGKIRRMRLDLLRPKERVMV